MDDEALVNEDNQVVDLGPGEQDILQDEVIASETGDLPAYVDDASAYADAAPVANTYSIDDVLQLLQDSQSTSETVEATPAPVQEYIDAIDSINLTFVQGLNVITGLVGLIVGCIAGTEFFKIWTTN